jgi:hypothetical protein
MNAETIRQLLRQRPFVPFEVRMTNGDVYQVRYPDYSMVLKTVMVIADPDADSVAICALDQFASVNKPNLADAG